jgi:hypothetical protein
MKGPKGEEGWDGQGGMTGPDHKRFASLRQPRTSANASSPELAFERCASQLTLLRDQTSRGYATCFVGRHRRASS